MVSPGFTGGELATTLTLNVVETHAGKASQAVAETDVVPTVFMTKAADDKVYVPDVYIKSKRCRSSNRDS